MSPDSFIDPALTISDHLVLKSLLSDAGRAESVKGHASHESDPEVPQFGEEKNESDDLDVLRLRRTTHSLARTGRFDSMSPICASPAEEIDDEDRSVIDNLQDLNDPTSKTFEPTVFCTWDTRNFHPLVARLLRPYISWAGKAVRHPTDVVFVTHLLLYFSTSVPSAVYLYWNFSFLHGFVHAAMQLYYIGTYTLLKHQHIHMNGVLAKRFPYTWIDILFPYVLDPLFGHTWNSYYYHHVKHHHVEGNGPNDLSSTLHYQRDSPLDLLKYVARFYWLIWLELPWYFLQTGKKKTAAKAFLWEVSTHVTIRFLKGRWFWPTIFVFIIPLVVVRMGLMIGNWGQHAFVDEEEPDSDFRSSITLIDVASNRYCFNDGYHTSHHLNPRRHWRAHPASFMKQKDRYAAERALTFRNIDYLMITFRLMIKDYDTLARCLVPMGEQIGMTLEQKKEMLQRKTRAFSKAETAEKFGAVGGHPSSTS